MVLPARNRRTARGSAAGAAYCEVSRSGRHVRARLSRPLRQLRRAGSITEFDHRCVRRAHRKARYRLESPFYLRYKFSMRPLALQRHSFRLKLHMPRFRQTPGAVRGRSGGSDSNAWLTASPRSPRGMLGAWGVSRVEGDARWRVRELDARRLARGTIDESARVGPTTFRRMNPMILHALMCLQPPLDDDVRPGPEPCLSITFPASP